MLSSVNITSMEQDDNVSGIFSGQQNKPQPADDQQLPGQPLFAHLAVSTSASGSLFSAPSAFTISTSIQSPNGALQHLSQKSNNQKNVLTAAERNASASNVSLAPSSCAQSPDDQLEHRSQGHTRGKYSRFTKAEISVLEKIYSKFHYLRYAEAHRLADTVKIERRRVIRWFQRRRQTDPNYESGMRSPLNDLSNRALRPEFLSVLHDGMRDWEANPVRQFDMNNPSLHQSAAVAPAHQSAAVDNSAYQSTAINPPAQVERDRLKHYLAEDQPDCDGALSSHQCSQFSNQQLFKELPGATADSFAQPRKPPYACKEPPDHIYCSAESPNASTQLSSGQPSKPLSALNLESSNQLSNQPPFVQPLHTSSKLPIDKLQFAASQDSVSWHSPLPSRNNQHLTGQQSKAQITDDQHLPGQPSSEQVALSTLSSNQSPFAQPSSEQVALSTLSSNQSPFAQPSREQRMSCQLLSDQCLSGQLPSDQLLSNQPSNDQSLFSQPVREPQPSSNLPSEQSSSSTKLSGAKLPSIQSSSYCQLSSSLTCNPSEFDELLDQLIYQPFDNKLFDKVWDLHLKHPLDQALVHTAWGKLLD